MRAMWQLWHKHLSKRTCEELIQKGLALPSQQGNVGFDGDARSDNSFRRSRIRWVDRRAPGWGWVIELIEHVVLVSNRNAFGFDLDYVHEIQFTEYSADYKGHYHWHEDLDWTNNKPYQRKLSFVCQLSDPSGYEGGKLELRFPDGEDPPADGLADQGSILVFPSFVKHRVTPITKGMRYSLVTWYEGPPFR